MWVSEEMFLAEHGLLKGIKMRVRVEFGHQGTEISQDSSSAGGLIGRFHQLLHGGGSTLVDIHGLPTGVSIPGTTFTRRLVVEEGVSQDDQPSGQLDSLFQTAGLHNHSVTLCNNSTLLCISYALLTNESFNVSGLVTICT